MKKGSLRKEMPVVTAFIDSLREAFGADMIDGQIRAGIKGEPVFWACENGNEVGTRIPRGVAIGWDPVTGVAKRLDVGGNDAQ